MQLWINNPDIHLHTHALTAAVEQVDQVRRNYVAAVGTTPSDTEMLTTHEACEFAIAMCDNYYIRYKTPLPDNYKLISAEQTLRVDIPGTAHYLEGRLDGLIQHTPTGRLDVLERKTYKNRPKQPDLQYNEQFLAYIYLVSRCFPDYDTPQVAYDGMWRRAITPKGKTFNDLFARYMITRSRDELADFERYLISIADDMARAYTSPAQHAYPHRPWQGCWDCQISKLCDSITRNEDYKQLIQANYTERTDDTTEETTADGDE